MPDSVEKEKSYKEQVEAVKQILKDIKEYHGHKFDWIEGLNINTSIEELLSLIQQISRDRLKFLLDKKPSKSNDVFEMMKFRMIILRSIYVVLTLEYKNRCDFNFSPGTTHDEGFDLNDWAGTTHDERKGFGF